MIGKVHNPKTVTFVRGVERTGVFIDVFPVDIVEDDADFVARRKRIKSLKRKENAAFVLSSRGTSNVSFAQTMKCWLLTIGKPRTYFASRINEIAKEKNASNGEMAFEMVAGVKCKHPMPKTIFGEYSDIRFENRTYMAVKDFHTYLTATFGDYMTLPSVEKQVCEHDFTSFWR